MDQSIVSGGGRSYVLRTSMTPVSDEIILWAQNQRGGDKFLMEEGKIDIEFCLKEKIISGIPPFYGIHRWHSWLVAQCWEWHGVDYVVNLRLGKTNHYCYILWLLLLFNFYGQIQEWIHGT